MANRQTMNVSLPPEQDRFVRTQVEGGRYRTASEVVREGLRLLEETEHRRLLEKWLYGALTPEEEGQLQPELLERVHAHFSRLIEEGIRSGEEEGWVDGPEAIQRLRQRIEERFGQR
jgi:antitoxin ParD1/3/4